MPSLLECSIDTVIKIFHQYSTEESHHDRLSQNEFKELVQKELPNFLKVGLDSQRPGLRMEGGVRSAVAKGKVGPFSPAGRGSGTLAPQALQLRWHRPSRERVSDPGLRASPALGRGLWW